VPTPEAAQAHQRRQRVITNAAAQDAQRRWARVDPQAISASWQRQIPAMTTVVTGSQYAAAAGADHYTQAAMAETSGPPVAEYAVVASALAGVTADGEPLPSVLYEPVITALSAIKKGEPVGRALASGHAQLDMIVRTEVADAGRTADQISATTHGAEGYIRVTVGPTCSRCLILAGKWYEWNAGFQRHPRCDCIGVPAPEASDLIQSPEQLYKETTPEQRTRAGYNEADQKALALGADLSAVTNIHRGGLYVAGGKQYTREGQGRGKKKRARITPRQIFIEAGSDREEAIRLLRLHNYIR